MKSVNRKKEYHTRTKVHEEDIVGHGENDMSFRIFRIFKFLAADWVIGITSDQSSFTFFNEP